MKQSIITAFLGTTQDKFSEYQEPTNLEQRLEIVSKIQGITGVEIVYPYETGEADATVSLMKEHGLNLLPSMQILKKKLSLFREHCPDLRKRCVRRQLPLLSKRRIMLYRSVLLWLPVAHYPMVSITSFKLTTPKLGSL